MAYVKLDVGILDSTLWVDKDSRDLFITALLMAVPREFPEPVPQIKVTTIEQTGFTAPPGWYGFVAAAGPGIIRRCGMEPEAGTQALERLGSPEAGSRSSAFEGRRLIRIDGGYMVLNYMTYRDKDHTAAERQRRYREKKRSVTTGNVPVTPLPLHETRNITQADTDTDTLKSRSTTNALEDRRNMLVEQSKALAKAKSASRA